MPSIILYLVFSFVFVLIISILLSKYKELERKCQEYNLRYQAEKKFNSDLKAEIRKYQEIDKGLHV